MQRPPTSPPQVSYKIPRPLFSPADLIVWSQGWEKQTQFEAFCVYVLAEILKERNHEPPEKCIS